MVDGQFVSELELEDLHEIRVGDAIFKFVEAGAESYARYRIDGAIAERRRPRPGPVPLRLAATRIVGGYQIRLLLRALERVAQERDLGRHPRRERHRQGGVRARAPRRRAAARAPFQAINCAAIPRDAARERAVRLQARRVHRRRPRQGRASSARPTAARCSSTRSATCRSTRRRSCCACCSRRRSSRSARRRRSASTSASCARPTAISTQLQRDGALPRRSLRAPERVRVRLPPLRERKEDIFILCRAHAGAPRARPDLRPHVLVHDGALALRLAVQRARARGAIKRGVALATATSSTRRTCPTRSRTAMQEYGVLTAEGDVFDRGPATAPSGRDSPFARAPATRAPWSRRPAATLRRSAGRRARREQAARSGTPTEHELRALLDAPPRQRGGRRAGVRQGADAGAPLAEEVRDRRRADYR